MIDKIVEMILEEARKSKLPLRRQKIMAVYSDVWGALVNILDNLRDEERGKKENES